MSDLLKTINVLSAQGEALLGGIDLEKLLGLSGTRSDSAIGAISAIIPSRNEGAKVARTVRSLVHGRSCAFPLEVVVVDDASTDRSCDRLHEIAGESPNVSVVVRRLGRWSGIPASRNRGAEISHHPIYLITDANTTYPKNWDASIRKHFHPRRIMTGTIVDEETGYRGYGLSLEMPLMGVKWITDPGRYGGYTPVAACTCTVIDRRLFHGLGGYDETLPLYGAAEPEFSVRAWLSGYEIVNLPEMLVLHRFRSSDRRSDFLNKNQNVLLKNYVRFSCSYLPDEALKESLARFAQQMGSAFDPCMRDLEGEGIWNRREQLRKVLNRDFSWLSHRFGLDSSSHTVLGSGKPAWAANWAPSAAAGDLARTLVVIPTFKHDDLTRTAIKDCLRERVRIVVVDNSGDYRPIGNETVLRPGQNLGWLRANNWAIQGAFRDNNWDRVVLLNNDVRLSANFFAGMVWAERQSGASIVAASYDDSWAVQRPENLPEGQALDASRFAPEPRNIPTGACDGTAVSIRRAALECIGIFDEARFGKFGWSGMTDLCFRARAAGLGIVATRAAYVQHLGGGHQTAKRVIGKHYEQFAYEEANASMIEKWGPQWRELRHVSAHVQVDQLAQHRTVVYTAVLGDYDQLEPAFADDVEHICFTDQRNLKAKGWRVIQVKDLPPNMTVDERVRLARRLKLLPQEYLPGYQIWIWRDANLQMRRKPSDLAAHFLNVVDVATFQHPKRNCIYDEAKGCANAGKDSPGKIYDQVGRYQAEGYPTNNGLVWSALLIRRNTSQVRALNEAWWAELSAGSRRDQLSFNYVAWKMGLPYARIPEDTVAVNLHKEKIYHAPAFLNGRELTILLLNWRRPHNLQQILGSIDRQSKKANVFLWNNGERVVDPRVDWYVESSKNRLCWPRWAIGAMADTEFVCSLDDDFAFADDRVIEDLLNYLKRLDQPDRLVGAEGVVLDPGKPYQRCGHVQSASNRDIPVDIVKGKLLACRRDTLRSMAMVAETREDDIAVSGLAAQGRPLHHRVPSLFHNRMFRLPEYGVGLSHAGEHNGSREGARRKYFAR